MTANAKARTAGALYLVVILTAGFAEAFVRGRLVVRNDASATAANILAHETLYRAGGAADVVNFVCDLMIALLLYELLKPVSRLGAAAAAIFRIIGDAMGLMLTVAHFAALVVIKNASSTSGFTPQQVQSQAFTFMRLHSQAYNIAMVLFGVHCVLLGFLVARSVFWPRIVGMLLVLAGVCYVFNSFGRLIAPPFAAIFFPYILWPGVLAEFALALWLVAFGVNEGAWNDRALLVA